MGPRWVEVIEVGQLSHAAWKRDREPARRIVVAKKGFGNCSASELSWIPGFENGRDVLFCPADRQRPALLENYDDWFSCGTHSLQQLLLIAGQTKVGAVDPLA